jgi:CheY-like chemotaxis protein
MRCRVLVVDDEDGFRASLSFMLEKVYWAVVYEASGAAAALTKVKESPDFQLILLDVLLPGMDGMEVCERMHAFGVTSRIVLMSAHDSAENRARAEALGVRFLSKPLHKDALRQLLLECGREHT